MFFSACYRPQNQVLAEMIFISIALLRSVVFILGKILQHEHFAIYILGQVTDFFQCPVLYLVHLYI